MSPVHSSVRIAIVDTHPIQYYAPLYCQLSKNPADFTIKVFYTLSQSQEKLHDLDFGFAFDWDIPLLKGYDYTFVNNTSAKPGSRSFGGIINPTLIEEIEDWKPDAVWVTGWAFSSHLKALRYFHNKIPVLFRGDSNLIDEPGGFAVKKILRRLFLRWVYRYVDYALYVGEANKQYYLAHGLKQEQLVFAPHAIDNDRFTNNEKNFQSQAAHWRLELGITSNEFVFLFAGKLTAKKDPELLIKAFIALNQADTRLIVIGNGELETELKSSYQTNTQIIFLPFQNQSKMPVVYRLANMFVLPSKGPGETWGLAVNEAMACGRGVIVSDRCGCAEDLVCNGRNGYIFKNSNLENLKNCLNLSLDNYEEFGNQSVKIIEKFSYQKIVEQLNLLFRKELSILGIKQNL